MDKHTKALLAAVRPMVAMTLAEAREKELHLIPFMYCEFDPLNACWDARPEDVPGRHWSGLGNACSECNLRAAIAQATLPPMTAEDWAKVERDDERAFQIPDGPDGDDEGEQP